MKLRAEVFSIQRVTLGLVENKVLPLEAAILLGQNNRRATRWAVGSSTV